jgi:leader peptidase (prepilin peptidase)/N-methyltransferase
VTLLLAAFAGLLGLAVGSFLNVVVHRVPRGESVVSPPSRCPRCASPIRARDNVPVISWLLLRGRCRHCGEPISARYPLVELLTAAVFVAFALRFRDDLAVLPAYLFLGAAGVALALIDLDVRRLPNALVYPCYAAGLTLLGVAALAGGDLAALGRAVAGMAALFAFYFVLWYVKPGGMGFGDVRLAGVLGLYLGWLGWGSLLVGLFAGFLFGGLTGLALMAVGRAGRKSRIPYGPFMLAGAFVAVLAGQPLAAAYTSLTLG